MSRFARNISTIEGLGADGTETSDKRLADDRRALFPALAVSTGGALARPAGRATCRTAGSITSNISDAPVALMAHSTPNAHGPDRQ